MKKKQVHQLQIRYKKNQQTRPLHRCCPLLICSISFLLLKERILFAHNTQTCFHAVRKYNIPVSSSQPAFITHWPYFAQNKFILVQARKNPEEIAAGLWPLPHNFHYYFWPLGHCIV